MTHNTCVRLPLLHTPFCRHPSLFALLSYSAQGRHVVWEHPPPSPTLADRMCISLRQFCVLHGTPPPSGLLLPQVTSLAPSAYVARQQATSGDGSGSSSSGSAEQPPSSRLATLRGLLADPERVQSYLALTTGVCWGTVTETGLPQGFILDD